MEETMVTHEGIGPVFDASSKILLLGTMPSPKSRETGFYYGHAQNRFWRVLADLLREEVPTGKEERIKFLLRHQIALWDVLESCVISGADDGSIRMPKANDLSVILDKAPIMAIFTTGTKAAKLYQKLCFPLTGRQAVALPSTSPANCRRYTYETLREAYRVILPYLSEKTGD